MPFYLVPERDEGADDEDGQGYAGKERGCEGQNFGDSVYLVQGGVSFWAGV